MQSDNCGAPCEHLLNIYQVMITFGFIETEDRQTFDINNDDRKNIYAPSCTCCNSEKSNIEIISFKNNNWQVNEKNVEKILKQVKDSKRECCYKNGHPDEPKDKTRDDHAVWVKPSKTDNDKCSTINVAFPGETETRPLYNYSNDAINTRKTEIVKMLQKRVDVLNAKVPRPKATSNLPYLNAIIQIATFFTHISLNAYKKMATEMAGRTVLGGAPPAAGAGDDNIYELCSDADADCFDIEVYENIFKKEFENHFWEEFEIGVTTTTFDSSSTTEDNINSLISTLSTKNTEIMNITTGNIKIVYDYLLKEDHKIQEKVEKEKQVLQVDTAKSFKDLMLEQLPKTEETEETEDSDRSVSPVIQIQPLKTNKGSLAVEDSTSDATIGSSDTDTDSNEEPDDNKKLPIFNPHEYDQLLKNSGSQPYGFSSDSEPFGTEDVKGVISSDSQPYADSDSQPGFDYLQQPSLLQRRKIVPIKVTTNNNFEDDPELASIKWGERPSKSQRISTNTTPGSRPASKTPGSRPDSRTGTTPYFNELGFNSRNSSRNSSRNRTRSREFTSPNNLGGKKTRKNKTRKLNKTRKQKPKKQTKRISYVKNKQTRKNKKRIKKSNSKKST